MEDSVIYKRLAEAKKDKKLLNELITDYLPFIRNCVKKQVFNNQSVNDAMTIAMLSFTNCVNSYETNKGNFFAFAEKCIRRSIIDDYRSNSRHDNVLPFDGIDNDENHHFENKVSIIQFETLNQQRELQFEIEDFAGELIKYGISFDDLTKICPKQNRSRKLCQQIAETIMNNNEMKQSYIKTGRIPQSEIASILNISIKTIEKHRKYLTVLLTILNGDFPKIRAFLPEITEGRCK